MTQYDNTSRFVLFKNDKGGNDKRPDYRGSINIEGVEYDLSAWIKTSQKGDKFMSGSFQPKRGNAMSAAPAPTKADFDDSIPFAIFLAPLAGVLAYAAYAQDVLPL